jgi:hypothetical protein
MYPQHLPDDLSDPQFVSRASALATDCEVEVAADPKRSVTGSETEQGSWYGPVLLTLNAKLTYRLLQGRRSNRSSTRSTE